MGRYLSRRAQNPSVSGARAAALSDDTGASPPAVKDLPASRFLLDGWVPRPRARTARGGASREIFASEVVVVVVFFAVWLCAVVVFVVVLALAGGWRPFSVPVWRRVGAFRVPCVRLVGGRLVPGWAWFGGRFVRVGWRPRPWVVWLRQWRAGARVWGWRWALRALVRALWAAVRRGARRARLRAGGPRPPPPENPSEEMRVRRGGGFAPPPTYQ